MIAAALDYAARGMPVLPLNGKVPLTAHGLTDASTDVACVREWWQRWPDANVGIRTGAVSGFVVVDVDVPAGLKSLLTLVKKHGRISTARVLTGTGGQHLWYTHPGGEVRNSAGMLGDGLDVRGDGGYVVAPPSIHPDTGKLYQWSRGLERGEPCPSWLLSQFTARYNGAAAQPVGEVIPEGRRRAAMLTVAGKLKRAGLSGEEILPTLRKLNERCVPPLEERELESVALKSTIVADAGASVGAAANGVPLGLAATGLAQIAMRSITWFEKPTWQRSAFQLLAGPKGAGKGTYLAGLAARFTHTGLNVMFVSSEDSVAIDLKPRVVAAGADIARCFVIQRHVRLPDDVEQLRELALGIGAVGLIVIDPVANHIGDRNSNSDAEVRDAIAPLNKLADQLDCLIVGVRHPGKDRSRGALASILGSTAWTDTPRAVVMIAADDEDTAVRHIQVVAGNRSLNGAAQAFRIEAVPVEGLAEPITLAVALGESAKTVDALLAARAGGDASRTGQARELILSILENDGEQESDTLDARVARETGLAAQTIRNVRGTLKNEGLIKTFPDKDEFGAILRWVVSRSGAPRT